jgi:hypothetical protein
MVVAFAIYLAVPSSNHQARFAALVLAETGHYSELPALRESTAYSCPVCTPLIVTWAANNAGSESRRAVAVPLAVSCAQAVA